FRLAGDGDHLVAAAGEHVHGNRTDAAGGAGDHYRAVAGLEAIVFHAVDGKRGGETGGADHHRLLLGEAFRQRDHVLARHAHVFAVAAIAVLAQAAAGDQNLVALGKAAVAGFNHGAGDVDAADQRELAKDLAGAGGGERVLVVHVRVLRADDHVAFGKIVEGQLLEAGLDLAGFL